MMLHAIRAIIFATLFISLYGLVCAVAARPLWAIIVDGGLALVPSIDAHILQYPFWDQVVVYYITWAVLRYADGRTSKKWLRTVTKLAIVGGAELLISVGAAEECNRSLTNCHYLLGGNLGTYVISVVAISITLGWVYSAGKARERRRLTHISEWINLYCGYAQCYEFALVLTKEIDRKIVIRAWSRMQHPRLEGIMAGTTLLIIIGIFTGAFLYLTRG